MQIFAVRWRWTRTLIANVVTNPFYSSLAFERIWKDIENAFRNYSQKFRELTYRNLWYLFVPVQTIVRVPQVKCSNPFSTMKSNGDTPNMWRVRREHEHYLRTKNGQFDSILNEILFSSSNSNKFMRTMVKAWSYKVKTFLWFKLNTNETERNTKHFSKQNEFFLNKYKIRISTTVQIHSNRFSTSHSGF